MREEGLDEKAEHGLDQEEHPQVEMELRLGVRMEEGLVLITNLFHTGKEGVS